MMEEQELTVYELAERWDDLKWVYGIEKLLVTECFSNGVIKKEYVVSGLSMEIEQDCAMCDDHSHTIIEMLSLLMMFLVDKLTRIVLFPYKDWYKERLEFGTDTVIYVEKA